MGGVAPHRDGGRAPGAVAGRGAAAHGGGVQTLHRRRRAGGRGGVPRGVRRGRRGQGRRLAGVAGADRRHGKGHGRGAGPRKHPDGRGGQAGVPQCLDRGRHPRQLRRCGQGGRAAPRRAQAGARRHRNHHLPGRRHGARHRAQQGRRGRAPPRAHPDRPGRPAHDHGQDGAAGHRPGGGVQPQRQPPEPRRVAGPVLQPEGRAGHRRREVPRLLPPLYERRFGRHPGRRQLPPQLRPLPPRRSQDVRARPAAPQRPARRGGVRAGAGAAVPRAQDTRGEARACAARGCSTTATRATRTWPST